MDVPSQQSLDLRALMNRSRIVKSKTPNRSRIVKSKTPNRSRIVKSKTPYRSRIVMFLHNFDSCVIIRTYASVLCYART